MPRGEDIAWKFVIRKGKKWRCPYCENEYSGSVTRVKSHFLKQPKVGIASCTKVPEPISTLMDSLHNQIRNKEDIAWKFVDRLGDNRWRCHYCSEELSGDLTGVKGHLLNVPYERISICTKVPDPVRKLMRSLLDEVAEEEESRDANGQSSTEPQSGDMPTQAEVVEEERIEANVQFPMEQPSPLLKEFSLESVEDIMTHLNFNVQFSTEPQTRDMPTPAEWVAEEENREANVQFSTGPQSRDMPPQAEAAEEGSREANSQFFTGPRSGDMLSPAVPWSPESWNLVAPFMANPTSDHQGERQFHQSSTTPSVVQNSHGETISCSTMALVEVDSYLRNSPNQPECSIQSLYPDETLMNDQQTPAGASSFQHDELPAVGNSNCLQDCNQHSLLQTPMDIDQSIGSQHTSDSHIIEATIVDLQVPEVATNATGPSSSQDMNRGSPIMNVRSTYANDEEIRNLKRKVEVLDDKEAVIKEQMEIESAASSVRKKPRILVERWLKETERARNNFQIIGQANAGTLPPKEQVETLTREVKELIEQTLPQTLLIEARDAKGDAFLERKLIGEKIHRNIELIWDRLKENHVCKLGIYGMGGVGKTTIMMHIHNRLLKDATFDGVLFITVSQDFNIYKLQSDIWKALKSGDMKVVHEKKRAATLSKHLETKKNCVLILDDVWQHFKLQDVGIPDGAGLKVVLTTRFSKVCSRMDCEEIKIQPLGEEEAWKLFVEDLGPKPLTNTQVEKVARKIVNRCAGLPLAINTMASSLRGEENFCVWQDTLNKLDKSHTKHTEMGDKVLPVLTLSYERLSDPQVKQCFLLCALFPEDERTEQMELIEYFIDEGFLDGLDTRDAQYYRGLAIVDVLRNACLLEVNRGLVSMHDLIREMALHIRGTTYMVKMGRGMRRIPNRKYRIEDLEKDLEEVSLMRRIPNEEYWTEDLQKVSLMRGYIEDIPPDMSPNCPKLSTLLLNGSLQLENVQLKDSFFMKLQGLKVLNVSGCAMRVLPDSLSELVNLRALLLRNCRSLLFIPHLRKLTFLRKLDANGCRSLVEVQGLEELRNLRYLDLDDTGIERLLEGTLRRIVNLQYLKIAGTVEAEEVIQLKALESLKCNFGNVDDFNKYVRLIERSGPHHYNLIVDQKKSLWSVTTHVYPDPRESLWIQESHYNSYRRSVKMRSCNCAMVRLGKESNNDSILIPGDVEFFTWSNCHGMTNLSSVGLPRCLKRLEIIKWDDLVVLFGGYGVDEEEVCNTRDSPASLFPSLETLQIEGCSKLKYLFGHESGFSLPLGGPAFPNLRKIEVENCNSIRELLPHESLLHLPNLEDIRVRGCEGIEGIISRRGENHEGSPPLNTPSSSLPSPFSPYLSNLRTITVQNCNNIRELLPHECFLHLPNPEHIKVSDCERIDEIISGGGENRRGSATLSTPSSSLLSPFSPHFPNLRSIAVINCNSIRELLPHESLLHLPNLEEIWVVRCEGIEGIISRRGENHEGSPPLNTPSSSLPSPFSPYLRNLRTIEVYDCNNIRELLSHECFLHLPNLERIKVRDCERIDEIISGGGENRRGSAPLSTPSSSLLSPFSPHFPNLREIEVTYCNNIRELLSHECLPHFPNLECIMVIGCGGIEEIISEGGENRGENHEEGAPLNTHSSSLPSPFSALKLKMLVLRDLPQLKNIMWEGALIFVPDAFVGVRDCPKLKTIPPCVERLNVYRRCQADEMHLVQHLIPR